MQKQSNIAAVVNNTVSLYRFEIFKGYKDENGKVIRIKSVGDAYLREGMNTYSASLKTFLDDKFYLLQNTKVDAKYDYAILTREISKNLDRKYFWNNVGTGKVLGAPNEGIMQLSWDILAGDIYMNLHPIKVTEVSSSSTAIAA